MGRRVVVTGMGAVSPLGLDVATSWAGLVEGRSGIATISQFDAQLTTQDTSVRMGDPRPPRPALKPKSIELTLAPVDNQRLAHLCGALDENLRQIETALDVTIARRGDHFTVRGDADRPRAPRSCSSTSTPRAGELTVDDVQLGLVELRRPAHARTSPSMPPLLTRRADLHGRTPHQASTSRTSSTTTSPSASARPAPARPTSRSRARWTRSSATR